MELDKEISQRAGVTKREIVIAGTNCDSYVASYPPSPQLEKLPTETE